MEMHQEFFILQSTSKKLKTYFLRRRHSNLGARTINLKKSCQSLENPWKVSSKMNKNSNQNQEIVEKFTEIKLSTVGKVE